MFNAIGIFFTENFSFTGWLPVDIGMAYLLTGIFTLMLCKVESSFHTDRADSTGDDIMTTTLWPIVWIFIFLWILHNFWSGPRKLWRHK